MLKIKWDQVLRGNTKAMHRCKGHVGWYISVIWNKHFLYTPESSQTIAWNIHMPLYSLFMNHRQLPFWMSPIQTTFDSLRRLHLSKVTTRHHYLVKPDASRHDHSYLYAYMHYILSSTYEWRRIRYNLGSRYKSFHSRGSKDKLLHTKETTTVYLLVKDSITRERNREKRLKKTLVDQMQNLSEWCNIVQFKWLHWQIGRYKTIKELRMYTYFQSIQAKV